MQESSLVVQLAVSLVINVICLILCPIIAGWKGRSVVGWIFGGLFLSLLGLIIIACLPNLNKKSDDRKDNDDCDKE